jgi:hypothetical protein
MRLNLVHWEREEHLLTQDFASKTPKVASNNISAWPSSGFVTLPSEFDFLGYSEL